MEERLTELEIKICHQDQIIEDLNQLVTEQQRKLDLLASQIKRLTDTTTANGMPSLLDASQETPPPHY